MYHYDKFLKVLVRKKTHTEIERRSRSVYASKICAFCAAMLLGRLMITCPPLTTTCRFGTVAAGSLRENLPRRDHLASRFFGVRLFRLGADPRKGRHGRETHPIKFRGVGRQTLGEIGGALLFEGRGELVNQQLGRGGGSAPRKIPSGRGCARSARRRRRNSRPWWTWSPRRRKRVPRLGARGGERSRFCRSRSARAAVAASWRHFKRLLPARFSCPHHPLQG